MMIPIYISYTPVSPVSLSHTIGSNRKTRDQRFQGPVSPPSHPVSPQAQTQVGRRPTRRSKTCITGKRLHPVGLSGQVGSRSSSPSPSRGADSRAANLRFSSSRSFRFARDAARAAPLSPNSSSFSSRFAAVSTRVSSSAPSSLKNSGGSCSSNESKSTWDRRRKTLVENKPGLTHRVRLHRGVGTFHRQVQRRLGRVGLEDRLVQGAERLRLVAAAVQLGQEAFLLNLLHLRGHGSSQATLLEKQLKSRRLLGGQATA